MCTAHVATPWRRKKKQQQRKPQKCELISLRCSLRALKSILHTYEHGTNSDGAESRGVQKKSCFSSIASTYQNVVCQISEIGFCSYTTHQIEYFFFFSFGQVHYRHIIFTSRSKKNIYSSAIKVNAKFLFSSNIPFCLSF